MLQHKREYYRNSQFNTGYTKIGIHYNSLWSSHYSSIAQKTNIYWAGSLTPQIIYNYYDPVDYAECTEINDTLVVRYAS